MIGMKQNVIHGTIYLTVAQAVFVFSGYAIHMGLARLLGPAGYVNLTRLYGEHRILGKIVTNGEPVFRGHIVVRPHG